MPHSGARAVHRGRAARQARVPHHLEGDPRRQRGPAQHHRRYGLRGHRRAQDDPKQHLHHRQAQRRRTRHAVPITQTDQQYLGAPRAQTAARQPRGDPQSQVPHGGGRHVHIPSLRSHHQIVISPHFHMYMLL